MPHLTFADLATNEKFLFVDDNVPGRPDTDRVLQRMKTGATTYATQRDDGTIDLVERVGVGDNPVRRMQ